MMIIMRTIKGTMMMARDNDDNEDPFCANKCDKNTREP